MSKANRKREYERLVANDKLGVNPGISQDDGALVKEFGEPPTPSEPRKKGKKKDGG